MGKKSKSVAGANNPNYKTGLCRTRIYNIWQNIKGRCCRPNHPKYHRYGGRGIFLCDEWKDIANFAEWANGSGYDESKSIDRINNDDGYYPGNCRWVSISQNSRRKSTTKISFDQAKEIRTRILNGEKSADLAKEYGVVHGTIWFIQHNLTHVEDGECVKRLRAHKPQP